ncbi:MAG: 3-oxoacyl-(acyl-carrier-protein) reductase FabG [bacterium ADurb.Bin429]|nr:MAG: 3-oxoacyl-(acyl-carrier-protein) reductase FabG [bacterium ADurb.Bin429]
MAQSIQGKIALITGGAVRIGRATALALAAEGTHIIVHYNRSGEDAEALAEELRSLGIRAWPLQADFSRREEYETLIERALETAGGLDILVNNASIFPRETLDSVTIESVMENLEVNAWTPFALGRAFASAVGRGAIVNLLDSRLDGYDWTHVGYFFSKQVLELMTRMMALKFAPSVTVNAVAPGLILPPPGEDESYIDKLIYTVPLKEHGQPEDIADAIVFLAKSRYCTGEVIYVDGGRHLVEYSRSTPPL